MSSRPARGLLFIVSAPSGAGKTTLVERLVERTPHLKMSRSYTSRIARQGEADGVDYNFVQRARFEAMIAASEFLEWAEVFGNLYGTCAADTERMLAAGDDVVLVIDVQGARKVRSRGLAATTIFVMPPSAGILEQRLRGRSKDSEARHPAAAAWSRNRKSPRLASTISSSSTITSMPRLSGFNSSCSPSGRD